MNGNLTVRHLILHHLEEIDNVLMQAQPLKKKTKMVRSLLAGAV